MLTYSVYISTITCLDLTEIRTIIKDQFNVLLKFMDQADTGR
jgi:hypothetical protein